MAEGVQNNTFFELLKDDINEGKALFKQRVPESIRSKRDYLTEYLEEFVEKHRKTL